MQNDLVTVQIIDIIILRNSLNWKCSRHI